MVVSWSPKDMRGQRASATAAVSGVPKRAQDSNRVATGYIYLRQPGDGGEIKKCHINHSVLGTQSQKGHATPLREDTNDPYGLRFPGNRGIKKVVLLLLPWNLKIYSGEETKKLHICCCLKVATARGIKNATYRRNPKDLEIYLIPCTRCRCPQKKRNFSASCITQKWVPQMISRKFDSLLPG